MIEDDPRLRSAPTALVKVHSVRKVQIADAPNKRTQLAGKQHYQTVKKGVAPFPRRKPQRGRIGTWKFLHVISVLWADGCLHLHDAYELTGTNIIFCRSSRIELL
jgi:hypothetical protein